MRVAIQGAGNLMHYQCLPCTATIVTSYAYILDVCQTTTTSFSDHPASHLYLYSSIRLLTY